MKAGAERWKGVVRLAVCVLLLVWIFNSIFGIEGKISAERHKLVWTTLSRWERLEWSWRAGPRELLGRAALVPALNLAASLVCMLATILLGTARWRLALETQGLDLSAGRATRISFVAHFFNAFLLGSTGGDVMKAYYAARETHHKKAEAVVTVVVDRLVGMWSMLVFTAVMIVPNARMFFAPKLLVWSGLALAMLAGCSVALVLAFWGNGPVARLLSVPLSRFPKWTSLERSLAACGHFRQTSYLWKSVAMSMALNVCCVLQFWALSNGLGLIEPVGVLFGVVPLIVSISALPVTPNGLGVREGLFVLMLAPADRALSLSLLAYAGSLFWSLAGGLVYLWARDRERLAEVR